MNIILIMVQVLEILQVFSIGIIDVMIILFFIGVNGQVWDYLLYYIDIKVWILKNVVVVNKCVFCCLSDEQCQVILEVVVKVEDKGWIGVCVMVVEDIVILVENGIMVIEFLEELMQEFQKIGDIMIKEWEQEVLKEVGVIFENYC